jgi:hypothetical protein
MAKARRIGCNDDDYMTKIWEVLLNVSLLIIANVALAKLAQFRAVATKACLTPEQT